MFLSEYASTCRLLIRGTDLRKSMSRYLVDQIERDDHVEVRTQSQVVELHGKHELESIVIKDARSGEQTKLETRGLFVFIGASPHTDWLAGQLATDPAGFLLTGPEVNEEDLTEWGDERPLFLETSRPGVFAAGDVRSGSSKRVASAVGEGSMAIQLIHQRLADP
jgi:thioredoxin reductase (NADPH)